VIAMSARRADKAERWSRRQDTPAVGSGGDESDDKPPWWQTRGRPLRSGRGN
jgi:hypothetical protein